VNGFYLADAWKDPFKEAIKNFQPKPEPSAESDDVPF
jgi:hypothetical protein